jgi:hypothetical protein
MKRPSKRLVVTQSGRNVDIRLYEITHASPAYNTAMRSCTSTLQLLSRLRSLTLLYNGSFLNHIGSNYRGRRSNRVKYTRQYSPSTITLNALASAGLNAPFQPTQKEPNILRDPPV